MIDLHSHILPGIDDGARDLAQALEMARLAIDDGTRCLACTPHIYPGVYDNTASGIRDAVDDLRLALKEAGLELDLMAGADAHLVPALLPGLQEGRVPTLAGSRYFLLEPSHHVKPPMMEQTVQQILDHGYIPLITHPERLRWIEPHYALFVTLAEKGAWMQVTAAALTGDFGRRAEFWAKRLLDDGLVAIVASDAHGVNHRKPGLSAARRLVESWLGDEEAVAMFELRPQGVVADTSPDELPLPPGMR